MAETKQKKPSLQDRKTKFYEAFKVLYALYKGTYDIKHDPELFSAMVDVYYRLSFSIETRDFEEFMRRFRTELPSPFQWETEMVGYLRDKHPERQEKKREPLTDKERGFVTEMCGAMSIPHRAMKLYPCDGVNESLAKGLMLKIVFDKYKKPFASYWQDIISKAKPETLKVTQEFVDKYKDRLVISKGGFESIQPSFSKLFGPDIKDNLKPNSPK